MRRLGSWMIELKHEHPFRFECSREPELVIPKEP